MERHIECNLIKVDASSHLRRDGALKALGCDCNLCFNIYLKTRNIGNQFNQLVTFSILVSYYLHLNEEQKKRPVLCQSLEKKGASVVASAAS